MHFKFVAQLPNGNFQCIELKDIEKSVDTDAIALHYTLQINTALMASHHLYLLGMPHRTMVPEDDVAFYKTKPVLLYLQGVLKEDNISNVYNEATTQLVP